MEKLIKRRKSPEESPVYYVSIEDTYDIIKRAHIATGHGGRDRMIKHLSTKYANITREAIELFKSFCQECQKKRKRPMTKGVVVRPILSSEFSSRGQVDLIDMQSMAKGSFKWIMVYQDHLTKFCVLRPLTSKRAAEVAYQLVDIFLLFGAPAVLQSDNGSEFTAEVITELKQVWPLLNLVHGKPRHPQSQGSVERANGDIKDMLVAWMADNSSQDWTMGIRFVQFSKNSAHHSGINRSPYAAMFGSEAKVGLTSSSLPNEVIQRLQSEEDLLTLLNNPSDNTPPPSEDSTSTNPTPTDETSLSSSPASPSQPDIDSSFTLQIDQSQDTLDTDTPQNSPVPVAVTARPTTQPLTIEIHAETLPPSPCSPSPPVLSLQPATFQASQEFSQPPPLSPAPDSLNLRLQNIAQQRQDARIAQVSQAERMVKRSKVDLKAGAVGDNVAVPIPLVDRGRGDPRNILGVIIDRDENEQYRIATKSGILRSRYSRNQFDLCQQRLLQLQDMNQDKLVSLREAVTQSSAGGGQGFVKCSCATKQCQTNRCKCFKAKLKCNSRCHNSLTCKNK